MTIDATHLTSLFEHATEGIILTDGKGDIVLVNPAAQRMFGYDSAELLGKPIEILIPDRVRPHHHQLREGFYNEPQNRVMGHGRDLHGRHKEGKNIPVEVSLSFYRRDEELFVIAFIVDITHRKLIEQSILLQQKELETMAENMRRLNAQLETKVEERTTILKEALLELEKSQKDLHDALSKEKELNEIKSRFVSMASHEFRTPLSTVLSSAALTGKYTKSDEQEKRDKHLKRIKDSVKHLNDILEDFLSLGRLEEGRVKVQPESINVPGFLTEIIEELHAITKPGQTIDVVCREVKTFTTDKKLLKNILINLLSNAVKFSDPGKPIKLEARAMAQHLEISVADKGIGISKEDMEHLFSSFYRGKNAFNIQGTGLGLHIVKRYAELMNATVEVQSELNAGTTVTVILSPLQEADYSLKS